MNPTKILIGGAEFRGYAYDSFVRVTNTPYGPAYLGSFPRLIENSRQIQGRSSRQSGWDLNVGGNENFCDRSGVRS